MSNKELVILGCSSQQPTRKRNHGAYLVRWNEKGFLFDPGEGTQRQFIFANIAPTCVTHIFITHFHGDHCLGLGSMFMRLNLDKVTHPIHCYFPASGKVYFDRLRRSAIYHERIKVIEYPIEHSGVVEENDSFRIEAFFLKHGVDNCAFRIVEKDILKFDKQKLKEKGIEGKLVRKLEHDGVLFFENRSVMLNEVSFLKKGEIFSIVIDTLPCQEAIDAAQEATLLLCESTYLEKHSHLAAQYLHMTAMQAAQIALEANAKSLILTHFSARYQIAEWFEQEARTIFPNTHAAHDMRVFPFH